MKLVTPTYVIIRVKCARGTGCSTYIFKGLIISLMLFK